MIEQDMSLTDVQQFLLQRTVDWKRWTQGGGELADTVGKDTQNGLLPSLFQQALPIHRATEQTEFNILVPQTSPEQRKEATLVIGRHSVTPAFCHASQILTASADARSWSIP